MKLIVGLGNPGDAYRHSRHNVGFDVLDRLAKAWHVEIARKKFQGLIGLTQRGSQTAILVKPQTYMNRSGASVALAANFYQMDSKDILIVLDDMALNVGQLRIRAKGSAGGHNGLKDVLQAIGHDDLPRIRIGIGSPPQGESVDYVLGKMNPDQKSAVGEGMDKAVAAIECWFDAGIDEAMTRFNTRCEDASNEKNNEKTVNG